jgi:hypothetical protein
MLMLEAVLMLQYVLHENDAWGVVYIDPTFVSGSLKEQVLLCPKMQWSRFVVIATINFLSLSGYVLVEAHVP